MTVIDLHSGERSVPPVEDLLEQRSRILEWLGRLDELRREADERVVARIQADYQERLRQVVESLGLYLESLQAELDELHGRLTAAESRHAEAEDALTETRLRHLIGEISDEDWESRRKELEAAGEEAAASLREAREEADRLAEIIRQINAGVGRAPDGEETLPEPPRAGPVRAAVAEEDVTWEEPQHLREDSPPDDQEAETVSAGEEQDLSFLEALDRAIALSAELVGSQEDEEQPPRPPKGPKCGKCGYTNDPGARYCGVCGAPLP